MNRSSPEIDAEQAGGRVSDSPRWKPIISGKSREQALAAIDDIATALRSYRGSDPSLAGGHAGLAIFYSYLAKAMPGRGYEKTAARFLDRAITAVATKRMSAELFSGFPGIAWAAVHLSESAGGRAHDLAGAVAAQLTIYLQKSPWRRHYDLVSGLTGLGVYALEWLPAPRAVDCLKLTVDRLDETAEQTSDGLTWFTPPELLAPHQRKLYPGGYYNLGLAHGVPGPIALLGQICAERNHQLRSTQTKARRLLSGAVAWLLAREPKNRRTPFGYCVGTTPQSEARVAWCYGDLGIAVALFRAGQCVGERSWNQHALRIARRAAARPPERAGVIDCGLCHGAAGVGHLFNRLFQATAEPWLARAARLWFEQTLKMRQPGLGIAGFSAWRGPKKQWSAEPGLLEGAAGLGLALLAAATEIEPDWDLMLALSGPAFRSGHS